MLRTLQEIKTQILARDIPHPLLLLLLTLTLLLLDLWSQWGSVESGEILISVSLALGNIFARTGCIGRDVP
jgi:hypothetical protein